jgi:CHASE2 domain-containing sensor protein/tRNA A-37 threonylcarbamoyl transferase component Bud32
MRIIEKFPHWIIGLAATLFFLFITATGIFDFTDVMEMKAFDLRARITAPTERNADIELVVITDQDLVELGPFPWPRHIFAQGIENLALAGAKVIVLTMVFSEPEVNAGLKALERLRTQYEGAGLAQQGAGLAFYKELSKALTDLDNDGKLYRALEKAGNVVLPVFFEIQSKDRDLGTPDFINTHAYTQVKGVDQEWAVSSLVWASKVNPFMPLLAEVAAGIGHSNYFPDQDGLIRSQIHVLGYSGDMYFPSLPIAIVKLYKGLKGDNITVVLGEGINLEVSPSSVIKVPVADTQMRTLINWSHGPDVAFRHTPFHKVFRNQIQTSLFRDKIVIVGPTSSELTGRFVTPISRSLPGVEVVANSVANILNQQFFSRPPWIPFTEFAALILSGLFLTFSLPRLGAATGAVATLVLFLGYCAAGVSLFYYSHVLLRITPTISLLTLGYLLVTLMHLLSTKKSKGKVDAEEKATDFGELVEAVPEPLHTNSSRAFGPLEGDPRHSGTQFFDTGARPTLGRYELVGEIGRGSIGVVYKGQDPKLHRTVAVKALRLSEFDDDRVEEVKDLFFREAESAGTLTHPYIVTIYDCGKEKDLAYIVMEYVEGEDLGQYIATGHLLSIRDTLDIVARVADALEYAHAKNIVHKDIKPANIMRIKGGNEVKVTDFGLARFTRSSKTKTGMVLGTPFYMSPEQVSGKKVDGRSDIFSLAVVLFEMLTGQKPFTEDDIASLMLRLVNEKHPSPRAINPKIPRVVEDILGKALEKDVGKRYQRAAHLALHLKQVVARIDEILARKAQGGKRGGV